MADFIPVSMVAPPRFIDLGDGTWALKGAAIPAKVVTYTAVYRLAARPYALSWSAGAAGRNQLATIHHAATAVKKVRLRQVLAALESVSAAALAVLDLIRITTAPATGNPVVTPTIMEQSDAAAETTCLGLPTTQATEAGAPIGFQESNLGITGAASTNNPPPGLTWVDLIAPSVASQNDGTEKFPLIRAGVLEGFAVTADVSALTILKGYVIIRFTEE